MLARVLMRLAMWWGMRILGRYSWRVLKWGSIKLVQCWKRRRKARKIASFRQPRVTTRKRFGSLWQRLHKQTNSVTREDNPPPTTQTAKAGLFGRFRRKLSSVVLGSVDHGRRILEPPVARALQNTFDFVGLTLEVQHGR